MPQPTDSDSIREPFRASLQGLWPGRRDLALGDFGGAATGYSAQTLIIPIAFDADGQRCEDKASCACDIPQLASDDRGGAGRAALLTSTSAARMRPR